MPDSGAKSDRLTERGAGRFAALLSCAPCPRLPCDEVLLETAGCVVAPSLGSIVPYWLLAIPQQPVLNFREWRTATTSEPARLVDDILARLGICPSRAFWFEHGPESRQSTIGCGVDQAHIHIIIDAPFTFDSFVSRARQTSSVAWEEVCSRDVYALIPPTASYLIAAKEGEAVAAINVESVGSQFFRRVAADLAGRSAAWDYKTHPHSRNIKKTLAAFKQSSSELTNR